MKPVDNEKLQEHLDFMVKVGLLKFAFGRFSQPKISKKLSDKEWDVIKDMVCSAYYLGWDEGQQLPKENST